MAMLLVQMLEKAMNGELCQSSDNEFVINVGCRISKGLCVSGLLFSYCNDMMMEQPSEKEAQASSQVTSWSG